MDGLTREQARCKAFIACFIAGHGHSPSFSEIGAGLDLKSKSNVHRIVQALIARGHAAMPHKGIRAIRLIEQRSCPHCGGALEAPVAASPPSRPIARVINHVRRVRTAPLALSENSAGAR